MSRLRRKDIKRDEVLESVGRTVNFLREHTRGILGIVIGVVVVVLLVTLFFFYRGRQATLSGPPPPARVGMHITSMGVSICLAPVYIKCPTAGRAVDDLGVLRDLGRL